ncbi:MAG TPA: cytochrome P450, partial [Solirubrobacteraceae bacterium]|nr:cytochrome P450 [Solirubrobacteraceae bacterium]
CAARYGEPFTLRTQWADAPVVMVWDPEAVRRVFTAPPGALRAGASSAILEPFAGPASILVLDGAEHLRQRRLMLPPFHGDRLDAWRPVVAAEAAAEVERWPPGRPVTALPRMRALTLRVIMAAVFGGPQPDLQEEIRRALDMTHSLPRLVAMAVLRRDAGPRSPWGAFRRAVARVDARLLEVIRARRAGGPGGGILDDLLAATDEDGRPATDAEVRDQVVTLLAAGHETTAAALAFALERLARHPRVLDRLRAGDEAWLDATVKEVLRVRPVLTVAARKVVAPFEVAGWTLPPGVHVAPCIHLTHRRADLYPHPAAFRPERWLDGGAPGAYAWIPFGGGVRRCLGAAFATLEMREVLRAVAGRWRLDPERPRAEAVRRRAVTLTPARGGRVVPRPL